MALRVKVSARAASQIRKAAEWWAENRPAAPGAVRIDIGEALALLAQQPGFGTPYEGRKNQKRSSLAGRSHQVLHLLPRHTRCARGAGSLACEPQQTAGPVNA